MKAHKNNNSVLESQYKYCSQWMISYQISRDKKPLKDTNDKQAHKTMIISIRSVVPHFFRSQAKLK